MNRRFIILVLVPLLALTAVTIASAVATNMAYLPLVMSYPTYTPTATATATATPTPTATPTKTPTATATPDIYIEDIVYDPSGDPVQDEYLEIHNASNDDIDMTGWFIKAETGEKYDFPDNFTLQDGRRVKVWTGTGSDTASNLYWGSTEEIWVDHGNCAYLRDDNSTIIDKYCYP